MMRLGAANSIIEVFGGMHIFTKTKQSAKIDPAVLPHSCVNKDLTALLQV
jgi:hypothetical protein